MRIVFWPGLGGDAESLREIGPVLAKRGYDSVAIEPRYGARADWSMGVLADELAAVDDDPILAGHSWGAAVAVEAAARVAARALVLLDGGYVGPRDFHAFGGDPDLDGALATMLEEHRGFRWPDWDAYLDWTRAQTPRWNDDIETMLRSGMRVVEGEIHPPFDAAELGRIFRGYHGYDAPAALGRLPAELPVLLVVATEPPEHREAREGFIGRFESLVLNGEVRRVPSEHDLVLGLGPELGALIADWLAVRVAR